MYRIETAAMAVVSAIFLWNRLIEYERMCFFKILVRLCYEFKG